MKTRIDFRLDEEAKRLVEIAANLNGMTVSGYMNHLVNMSKEKILNDIGDRWAELATLDALVDLGVLDKMDVTNLNLLIRMKMTEFVLSESENKEVYLDFFIKEKNMFQKHVKEIVAEYIKNKKAES